MKKKTILMLFFFISFTSDAGYGFADIRLEVLQKKENGTDWDSLGGAPDPVICVSPSWGNHREKAICQSSGSGHRETYTFSVKAGILRTSILGAGYCKNRFLCSFRKFPLPQELFVIYVYDQDPVISDLVAIVCCKGDVCEYNRDSRLESFLMLVKPNRQEIKRVLSSNQENLKSSVSPQSAPVP
jgi:hypothetical protein